MRVPGVVVSVSRLKGRSRGPAMLATPGRAHVALPQDLSPLEKLGDELV